MPQIEPPRIPTQLEREELSSLGAQSEYFALSLADSDFSGQSANGIVLEEVRISRVNFTGTKLRRIRLADVEIEGSNFFPGPFWMGLVPPGLRFGTAA